MTEAAVIIKMLILVRPINPKRLLHLLILYDKGYALLLTDLDTDRN